MFKAPIPGQSLTSSPKKYPYERPPELNDPEEALKMHLTRLNKKGMAKNLTDALELGVDVVTLTEGILRNAVANGIHSIDVSLLIAPVIHEFIKKTADDVGIEYEEGLEDKEAIADRDQKVEKAKAYMKVDKRKAQLMGTKPDDEEIPMEEETPMTEEPEGLIARRK